MAEKMNKELSFDDSVKVNKRGEAILGTLYGPCADIIHPTRNGRKYPEELWDRIFNSEIINEYFESGGLLGELDHPTDRVETDTSKVAICMPEKPKKDKDGHLIAKFDILDTPNGRIAYTLAKYGYKLGVSSRGQGDVFEDYNGEEVVDSNSYDLQGFDLVLLPSVKAARLKLAESLQSTSFSRALTEALQRSTEDEKKIMLETLDNLNIKLDNLPELAVNIDEQVDHDAASDTGVDVVNELQESIKRQNELESKLCELQEKLSVCYAKEAKYEEDLNKYKSTIISLSDTAKQAKSYKVRYDSMCEQLEQKNDEISNYKDLISALLTNLTKNEQVYSKKLAFYEKMSKVQNNRVKEVSKLNESYSALVDDYKSKYSKLNETYEGLKQDYSLKELQYSKKLEKANNLVEHYRKVSIGILDKYIESKANMIGVQSSEIKNRLSENYSFEDIDTICEDLRSYKLNISKLPFQLNSNKSTQIKTKITERSEPIVMPNRFDDSVDDSLLKLARIND